MDLRLHALRGEQTLRGRSYQRGVQQVARDRGLRAGVLHTGRGRSPRALVAEGKEHLLDEALLDELAHGVVSDNDERVPVILAVSDNGPQIASTATALFMAGARIAQHFGRPGTPNDQWLGIENPNWCFFSDAPWSRDPGRRRVRRGGRDGPPDLAVRMLTRDSLVLAAFAAGGQAAPDRQLAHDLLQVATGSLKPRTSDILVTRPGCECGVARTFSGERAM